MAKVINNYIVDCIAQCVYEGTNIGLAEVICVLIGQFSGDVVIENKKFVVQQRFTKKDVVSLWGGVDGNTKTVDVSDRIQRRKFRRICAELRRDDYKNLDDDDLSLTPFDPCDLSKWFVVIHGPKDSLYEGGIFCGELCIDELHYPFRPPEFQFYTKIFHPSVFEDGKICHGGTHFCRSRCDGTNWSPVFTLTKTISDIKVLMSNPNDDQECTAHPAGNLFHTNKDEYEKVAVKWTKQFATNYKYNVCGSLNYFN